MTELYLYLRCWKKTYEKHEKLNFLYSFYLKNILVQKLKEKINPTSVHSQYINLTKAMLLFTEMSDCYLNTICTVFEVLDK